MKHKTSKGFVLFIVLLFISILSLLIVSQLELLLLQQRSHHQFFEGQQHRCNMELIAQKIIRAPSEQWPVACCIQGFENPNQIVNQLKNNPICSFREKDSDYHYVIEDLGIEACQRVLQHQQAFNAHHWRISVTPTDKNTPFLQIRFITLAIQKQPCLTQNMMTVTAGVLSWRLVT